MNKHTPGPWEPYKGSSMGDEYYIWGDFSSGPKPHKLIAEINHTNMVAMQCTFKESLANAKLIAAAPDLRDACIAVARYGTKGKMPDGRFAFDLVINALDKAIGGHDESYFE